MGAQCVYFFHGYEGDLRTGITRFVAKFLPRTPSEYSSKVGAIEIATADSWMGPFEDTIKHALEDVAHSKKLLLDLLIRANKAPAT